MNERLNLAIIMDGNRRWARSKGLPSAAGHDAGSKTLQKVLEWCKKKNIFSLTVYAFSTENFNRSEEELTDIFGLFRKFYQEFKNDPRINQDKIKIKFLGDLSKFPEDIQIMCAEFEEQTKDNTGYILQFCFGYGGRSEIIHATKKIVTEVTAGTLSAENINEQVFSSALYSDIEPDIVIRTGGMHRLSNFLTWQSVYAELFFIETLWPDISDNDLDNILEEYSARERRFGK